MVYVYPIIVNHVLRMCLNTYAANMEFFSIIILTPLTHLPTSFLLACYQHIGMGMLFFCTIYSHSEPQTASSSARIIRVPLVNPYEGDSWQG